MLKHLTACCGSTVKTCASFVLTDISLDYPWYRVTPSMERVPSWEDSRCLEIHENLLHLWNPTVSYRVKNSPPWQYLEPVESTLHFIVYSINFNIISHLRLHLRKVCFVQCFRQQFCRQFSFPPCNLLYVTLIASREENIFLKPTTL